MSGTDPKAASFAVVNTRIIIWATTMLFAATTCCGQHFVPAKGSRAEFKVAYHSSTGEKEAIKGAMKNFAGKITFDPKQLATASFDVTVSSSSAATGITGIDRDLHSEQYLSSKLYPQIRIVSTSVTADRPGSIFYQLKGNLSIKGITRPVTVQFTASPVAGGYIFRGTLRLSRQMYNLGSAGDVDHNVSVFIEIRTVKK